jgi:hypothetical protein
MKILALTLLMAAAATPSPGVKGDNRVADEELLSGAHPVIRVISPEASCYVIRSGSEQRVLILVEIVAAAGADIAVDDHGLPKFIEPSHNVDLFDSYVVSHHEYVNNLGQTVSQFASEIPVDALRTGDVAMSPPINYRRLDKTQKQHGFSVPVQSMITDVAEFHFRVKDQNGVESDGESPRSSLVIGFARELYLPPVTPSAPDEKPHEPTVTPNGS